MRQRGNRARLGLEAAAHLGIRGDVSRHHLQRDVPAEPGITAAIHNAHPAGTDGFDDFVLSETATRRE